MKKFAKLFIFVFILVSLFVFADAEKSDVFAACADAESYRTNCMAGARTNAEKNCAYAKGLSTYYTCIDNYAEILECEANYRRQAANCPVVAPPPAPVVVQPAPVVQQPPAQVPPPNNGISDPADPSNNLGGCGNNDGRCWDANPCTVDRCVNGSCQYSFQGSGYVCKYDSQTESTAELACNGRGSCNVSVYAPPPVPAARPVQSQPQEVAPVTTVDPEVEEIGQSGDEDVTVQPPQNSTPVVSRPSQPSPVYVQLPRRTEPRNYTPAIMCEYNGLKYFPGQKRYECSEPRTQSSCWQGAGSGVPQICDARGAWEAGNDGLNECADECAPQTPQTSECTEGSYTCIYSEEGGLCYGGTGGSGFNEGNCTYSCGPVQCPVLTDPNVESGGEMTEPAQSSGQEYCWGEMYSSCGSDAGAPMLMTNWYATPVQGEQGCNVFVRDGSGDHFISNNCNGTWSGTSLDEYGITPDGYYELYVSNGTDTCYNQQVATAQISCQQSVQEQPYEAPPEPTYIEDQGPVDMAIDTFTQWIE